MQEAVQSEQKSKRIRPIKSYVRREGRITSAQKRALEEWFPLYGLSVENGLLDLESTFHRKSRVILEIGFGSGEALIETAKQDSDTNFIGIDVYRPGVGLCLARIAQEELENVRLFCEDAVVVLEKAIPLQSLDGVRIFFPDPWPKKRHHKRRLIQLSFVELIHERLKPNGMLHIATDWEDYAQFALSVLESKKGWRNLAGKGEYHQRPSFRPLTKFERRGRGLQHEVRDLLFVKDF